MLIRVLYVAGPNLAQLPLNLEHQDVQIRIPGGPDSLWEELRSSPVDVLAIDHEALPNSMEAFVGDIRALPDAPEVIVLVRDSHPEVRAALQAASAFAILDCAVTPDEVSEAWQGIIDRLVVQRHLGWLAEQGEWESSLGDFASDSPSMREFLALARKVVASDSTLLLLGETGSGKEYLARAIHAESARASNPFVPVHCSALSEGLLESELFGHVEGAFTGATRGRRGYFELAHRGTLFLDEVGELSRQTQVKLLRVLQDRRVQPVGAEEDLAIDVRLIAATNRDLAQEVAAGRFRQDLFYRLSVVPLRLPPLRDRKEDIPRLFESHVEHFRIAMNKPVEGVDGEAMAALMRHSWPGNVRELINVTERAVLLCEGDSIGLRDLPEEIRSDRSVARSGPSAKVPKPRTHSEDVTAARIDFLERNGPLSPYREERDRFLAPFEEAYWVALLQRCHGRVGDAARMAGVSTRFLYDKLQELGLRKEHFRLT